MPHIVYVPQGKLGQFNTKTPSYDISGLYTDHFTSCNILIFFNKNTGIVELAHIDMAIAILPAQLKEYVQNLNVDATEVVLISREQEGSQLRNNLTQYFENQHPNKTLTITMINPEHDGVHVTARSKGDGSFELQTETYPIGVRPNGLIHHPNEEQYQTVQKIEQIIGTRARQKTQKMIHKKLCIFDGHAWEIIDKDELKIDQSHPMTQEEMRWFKKDEPYLKVAGKIGGIIQQAQREGIPLLATEMEDTMTSIAIYLEAYLNNYDHVLLFERNLKDTLTAPENKPISKEDKEFKEKVLQILKHQKNCFDAIKVLAEEYRKNAKEETKFKKDVLAEYNKLSVHYQDRKFYKDIAEEKKQETARAENMREKAVLAFRNKQYEAASNLFKETLPILTRCCLKSDELLANAYYNLGRTLFMLEKFQEAHFFLQTTVTLREHHIKTNQPELQKARKALVDCEAKLPTTNPPQQKTASLTI